MELIVPNEKCTGCGACISICPKKAISMIPDDEGFLYPKIDQKLCIDCGRCKRTCPVTQGKIYDVYNNLSKTLAVRNNLSVDRLKSSSGGFFPALARYIIQNGGVVVGASLNDAGFVQHIAITKLDELYKVQGSKYVQSQTQHLFPLIKKQLETGKMVLFSGLACQVAALKLFLNRHYENLICVDLICLGVPSPKVWRKYLDCYFENENKLKINFKDKRNGWHRFTFAITSDEREFWQIGKHNPYMISMFKTYSLRPSCFNCGFKNNIRNSDFTIADCWGAERISPELDDNMGLSAVIIHNSYALETWNKIKFQFDFKEISIDDVSKYNKMLNTYVKPKIVRRKIFFYLLNHHLPRTAFYFFGDNWKNTIRKIIRR